MALGRRGKNGLDLSGVGRSSNKLSGGRAKNRSGFVMAPHSSMPDAKRTKGVMSKSSFRGAMPGRRDRRFSARNIAMAVFVVLAAIALSVFVGYMVYQQTVRNAVKPELDSAALGSVLKPVEGENAPYWTVVLSTDASTSEEGRGQLVNLALMYVDPDNKSLSLLWIPKNTRVYVDGYGYRQISEAFDLGYETGICTAVSKLANIDITHYLESNRYGVSRLRELLGVEASEAPEDDPRAVVTAFAKKIFGSSSEQLTTRAESLVSCVASDMDAQMAEMECESLRGMNTDSEIYSESMPATEEAQNGVTYAITDVGNWTTMVARVTSGMSPVASSRELGDYAQIRARNVVDIWNGVGVTGVAGDCADELKKHGWEIETTTNAAQFVYEETLVVYKDNADEEAAKLLVADLGQGRVVRSAFRYNFTGSILVVVGKDYQPH